jgi:2-keto-4-pentenoate hydratase/2-oxohepta-3-ene-1,7-dioic acid hydratase in catechol pathway
VFWVFWQWISIKGKAIMKLVTYLAVTGGARLGVVMNDMVYDLSGLAQAVGSQLPSSMLEFLALGETGTKTARDVLSRVAAAGTWPGMVLGSVRLLAPIPRPPKILALAGNFQEHIKEAGHQAVNKQRITPRLFMKPTTSVIGPDEPILLPSTSDTIDWELELLVVIGRRGKDIAVEQAMRYVAGYAIFNDVSARTLKIADGRDLRDGDWFFDWLLGKWLDSFSAMGPYLVTGDDIPDPLNLKMRLYVNDQLKQDGNTGQMIFDIAETIAFASQYMTLEPGDVIATGTPSGVGHSTNTFLKAGDVVRGEIEGLGVLVNSVVSS